jgi:HEAT repeat protein
MNPQKPSSGLDHDAALRWIAIVALGIILAIGIYARTYHKSRTTAPDSASPTESSVIIVESNTADALSQVTPGIAARSVENGNSFVASDNIETNALSVEELARILKDTTQPIKARVKAARALIAIGSAEAIAAIKEVLWNGPPELRAEIGEALGTCANPESYSLMLILLGDKDEVVAMGAIRGLAHRDSREAADVLNQTLYNTTVPLNVRCEAAVALGTMSQPGVAESLIRGAGVINDESIVTQLLNALGGRPFAETKNFFQNYLNSTTTSGDLKVAAIEALGEAKGGAAPFLLGFAQNNDGEQRAAAAWALSVSDTPGAVGEQLTAWLQTETDPTVRLRLYQALGNDQTFDVATIQNLIQTESNVGAQAAGYDLIAKLILNNPTPELVGYFDQNAVAQLRNIALTAANASDRMTAVIALKRAGTAGSVAALDQLAAQATDPRVRNSAAGIRGKPAEKLPIHH